MPCLVSFFDSSRTRYAFGLLLTASVGCFRPDGRARESHDRSRPREVVLARSGITCPRRVTRDTSFLRGAKPLPLSPVYRSESSNVMERWSCAIGAPAGVDSLRSHTRDTDNLPPLAVDYGHATLLVATSGWKPTPGYEIDFSGAWLLGDTVFITVRESGPRPSYDAFTALSTPAVAATIPLRGNPVVFVTSAPPSAR